MRTIVLISLHLCVSLLYTPFFVVVHIFFAYDLTITAFLQCGRGKEEDICSEYDNVSRISGSVYRGDI